MRRFFNYIKRYIHKILNRNRMYYQVADVQIITDILNTGENPITPPFSYSNSSRDVLTYNYHKTRQVEFRIFYKVNHVEFFMGDPSLINLYDLDEELSKLIRTFSKTEDKIFSEFQRIHR